MKVRIVSYEDPGSWILGKFARNMVEELRVLSVQADIGSAPDPDADVNHHIIYCYWNGKRSGSGHETVMITHIDDITKLNMLRRQLQGSVTGICMSRHTLEDLAKAGIPRDRLCYVSPAHDGVLKPRKLVIGITSKLYPDGRKKEDFLLEASRGLAPDDFLIRIMGDGWARQVEALRSSGFEVEYHKAFDRERYLGMIPGLDYYMYFGEDEGSMGYLDALAAGVKTLVTPQGFHLDAKGGLTHPIRNPGDAIRVFKAAAEERNKRVRSVEDWTWKAYARKHLDIWEFLQGKRSSAVSGEEEDGLASLKAGDARARGSLASVQGAMVKARLMRNHFTFFLRRARNKAAKIMSGSQRPKD